jgi:FkbM family methyltransferase
MDNHKAYNLFSSSVKRLFGIFGLNIGWLQPEINKLSWLQSLKIDVILDVGANTGQFYKDIRKLLPTPVIYSFEPLPDCFAELKRIGANDRNFKPINVALSNHTGVVEFRKSSSSPSSSILPMSNLHKANFPVTSGETLVQVQSRRLDELDDEIEFGQNLLIKIDVQGAEKEVIQGGIHTVSRAKVLFIETSFQELYVGQTLFKEMTDMLYELGFVYFGGTGYLVSPLNGSNLCEDSIFLSGNLLNSQRALEIRA